MKMFDATKAIIDFYEESGEDEVSEQARDEIQGVLDQLAELEGQKARADWLDQLVKKSHEILVKHGLEESAALLWTAYSTPPQFDKDGVSGMVQDDQ